MKFLLTLFLVPFALTLPQDPADSDNQDEVDVDHSKKLAPIAVFAGQHRGQGRSRMGGYRERWVGEWINGKTAFMLRTESQSGGMTVFQDVRIFTWDPKKKRIRVRQFARGGVCTYDVEIKEEGKALVFHQRATEGLDRPEWRYTLKLARGEKQNQIHYNLQQKQGDAFQRYVMGRVVPKSE